MTEKMRESLSALMDNEANELELQRVLKQIGEDAELRQTWVRYNAARTAMTGQATESFSLDISARVSEAIREGARPGLRDRLLRPVASFAVAASVAATVVIGGQHVCTDSPCRQFGRNGCRQADRIHAGMNVQGDAPEHRRVFKARLVRPWFRHNQGKPFPLAKGSNGLKLNMVSVVGARKCTKNKLALHQARCH